MMDIVRFAAGVVLILIGVFFFALEIVGVFKYKYVLNRMHAAAMGDTMGLGCCILGLMLFAGPDMTALKLLLVLAFVWFSSPTCSHMVSRLEVATDEEARGREYRIPEDSAGADRDVL